KSPILVTEARMNKPIAMLAFAGLAGCASYVIPEGVPTAKLRFTSNANLHMVPRCGEQVKYVKQGMVGNQFWNEESAVQMYGTRPGKRNDVLERLIPAGKEIGFRLNGAVPSGTAGTALTCTIWAAFTPVQGEQYHMRYDIDVAAKECRARVSRLSQSNGTITETPVKSRTFKEDIWGVVAATPPC